VGSEKGCRVLRLIGYQIGATAPVCFAPITRSEK
jgi:hypothetical protein